MRALTKIRKVRDWVKAWLASSISHRVTFAAVSISLVVALILGLTSFGIVALLVSRSVQSELEAQASLTMQKLQGDLDALSGDLATMSGNSFIANGLVDSLGRDTYLLPFLHEYRSSAPFGTSIVLCDFRGNPVASNRAELAIPDLAKSGVAQVLSTGKPRCELLKLARGTALVLMQPVIFPPTGQAEGALVETVDVQELFRCETRHLGGKYLSRLLAGGVSVALESHGLAGSDLITVEHRLALAEPIRSLGLSFQVGVPGSTATRPLKTLALVYLFLGLVLVALVHVLAKRVARRLTLPLVSLSLTASRIAAGGSLELTAEVTGRDEVGTLARVFNEMLSKLRASQEQLESQVEIRTRQLREAHDLLENRVVIRTLELSEAYVQLEQEIESKLQLEQQLRQVQKMEAIGTLAGGIAHDFNNILTVIGSYSAITCLQMPESDPLKKNLEHINSAVERAANLTRSLLAFSRKQVMKTQDADLNGIVKNVEKFLLRVIGEDVHLTTRLQELSLPVHLDQGQIEQVLMNLATNARDAMPTGGALTIGVSLQVLDQGFLAAKGFPLAPGSYALITVSDSGSGMDPETMRKIFEPFYTTKEVGKGTGLGLAMVYGIVKQHNGHIDVCSKPGKGTDFKIYLPALDRRPDGVPQGVAPVDAPKGGTETILVAEDDAEIREVMSAILEDAGYRVILAVDGLDAVEKFGAFGAGIALVLMDMVMPRKSGKEAYLEILRLEPGVRVLFVSGYSADLITHRAELHEGAELLMKPVPPQELLRKVREMLDRGEAAGSSVAG